MRRLRSGLQAEERGHESRYGQPRLHPFASQAMRPSIQGSPSADGASNRVLAQGRQDERQRHDYSVDQHCSDGADVYGAAANASTSTLNSGRVKPETMSNVEAGGRTTSFMNSSRARM